MIVGLSKVDISPKNIGDVISLNDKKFDKLKTEIFVRCICFQPNKDEKFLVLSLDLVWIDNSFSDYIKDKVIKKYGIKSHQIAICCTHAHSSPQIISNFSKNKISSKNFQKHLVNKILYCIQESINSKIECNLEFETLKTNLNINRRKKILSVKNKKLSIVVANRPNKSGVVDSDICHMVLTNKYKKPLASIINFAAHPTLAKMSHISGDYPSLMIKNLERIYGDTYIGVFLQGFCGNVKPNISQKQQHLNLSLSRRLFLRFFDNEIFSKDLSHSEIQRYTVRLLNPLFGQTKKLNYDGLTSIIVKRDIYSMKGTAYTIIIQVVKLAKNFVIVFINAEIFTEYSIWIKEYLKNLGIFSMNVAYSNGMIGYLPTYKASCQGGYEVLTSLKRFCIDSPFSHDTEIKIKDSLIDAFSHLDI